MAKHQRKRKTAKKSTKMVDALLERHFAKAKEILEAFSPASAFLTPRHHFIFRGVSSDEYDLLPAAHRPGNLERFVNEVGDAVRMPLSSIGGRQQLEERAVLAFCAFASRSGLSLPEDSQFYRNKDLRDAVTLKPHSGCYPAPIQRSLFALAQHYGVPTSLLDWTYDPLVALYFAASTRRRDEEQKCAKGDNICVWALDVVTAGSPDEQGSYLAGKDRWVELVTAPYEGNPNLRAQQGVFTVVQWDVHAATTYPTLNDLIRGTSLRPVLYKLSVPASELVFVRRALFNAGYHAARIFPGFHSVIEGMRERTR